MKSLKNLAAAGIVLTGLVVGTGIYALTRSYFGLSNPDFKVCESANHGSELYNKYFVHFITNAKTSYVRYVIDVLPLRSVQGVS